MLIDDKEMVYDQQSKILQSEHSQFGIDLLTSGVEIRKRSENW